MASRGAFASGRWAGILPRARAALRRTREARRIWLLLLLAAIAPLLLFGSWTALDAARRAHDAAWRAAFQLADNVAERAGAELVGQLDMIGVLAASHTLDDGDLVAFQTEAQRVLAAHPLWDTIELAAPDGLQVMNLLRKPGQTLAPTADWPSFAAVLRTHRPVVGGIGPVGPISGRRLVTLRVPVMRGGVLRYVLSILMAPDKIRGIMLNVGMPAGWVGIVVDASGHIVARTRHDISVAGRMAGPQLRAAIAAAPSGSYASRTLEGTPVETVFCTLPGTDGWTVHFGIPAKVLRGPTRHALWFAAGASILAILLAVLLVSLASRQLAQRRREQQEAAARALRVSEQSRMMALDAAELGTWSWDVESDRFEASDRCRALLGLACVGPGASMRGVALKAVHVEDRAMLEEAFRRALRENSLLEAEFRVVAADGSLRWLRVTGRVVGSAMLQGVIADVSARKLADQHRRELQLRLAQAQEDDRRRIARELHDQVGQSVTALSLGLATLERKLAELGVAAACQGRIAWLRSLTGEIGRDIHRAALDLRPSALDDLGLHKGLLAAAAEWGERYGIAVSVQHVGAPVRLPAEIETVLYRVLQEALTNVLKHANARHVSILLEQRGDGFRAVVQDDGVGFDLDRTERALGHRLGLSGMRERLSLLSGTLEIETEPGRGTTLYIQLPVQLAGAAAA